MYSSAIALLQFGCNNLRGCTLIFLIERFV
nr:MAG TPA: hypothetical protein [Caudoviricetes sp.]